MVKKDIVPEAGPSTQLSILIVTYNSVETIEACIESLFIGSRSVDLEIIVVDNHSTDGTIDVLNTLEREHPELQTLLNKTNRGFAVGNNQALEIARGKQVLILNPDTLVKPGCLSGLITELETNEKIAIAAPQLQFPNGRIQKSCRRFPKYLDVVYHSLGFAQLFPQSAHFNSWKMGDFDHKQRCQVDQPAGAALLVSADILREMKGFDTNFPMFFNDVDLCKRVKDAGYEIWYFPEYVIAHIGGASVKQAKVKMTISSHISFFRYFEKHFTRLHQQPFNFLVGILLYLSLIPRILYLAIFRAKAESSRETL